MKSFNEKIKLLSEEDYRSLISIYPDIEKFQNTISSLNYYIYNQLVLDDHYDRSWGLVDEIFNDESFSFFQELKGNKRRFLVTEK